MLGTLMKIGPTASILGLILCCLWDANHGGTIPKASSASKRISRHCFNPGSKITSTRDPFNLKPLRQLKNKEGSNSINTKKSVDTKEITVKPLPNLQLTGTSFGGQKLAIINNRIYTENEHLRVQGATEWIVVQVMRESVALQNGNQRVVLKLASTARSLSPKSTSKHSFDQQKANPKKKPNPGRT